MLRDELSKRFLTHISGGVVVQLAQVRPVKRRGCDTRKTVPRIGLVLRDSGIHGVECAVERVKRRRTRRCRGVIRARDRVAAGVVDNRLDAILLDRLQELGRDKRIGGTLIGAVGHKTLVLVTHQHGHDQEHGNRDDCCAPTGFVVVLLVSLWSH